MTNLSIDRRGESKMMNLSIDRVATPIGAVELVVRDGALCALDFEERGEILRRRLRKRFGAVGLADRHDPAGIATRLRAYLAGALDVFADLEIDPGGTPFQRAVWQELLRIPACTTRSYGELARRLGRPSASRAVGAANGRNPIAIVVPCHRVIAHDGKLTGYASGLERKRWLLAHEAAYAG